MSESYPIIKGVPIPETRGRKRGLADRHESARRAAVAKGVELVAQGKSCVDAAKLVHDDYPGVSHQRMEKLIRQARKVIHQG